jgi:hypothetical protein
MLTHLSRIWHRMTGKAPQVLPDVTGIGPGSLRIVQLTDAAIHESVDRDTAVSLEGAPAGGGTFAACEPAFLAGVGARIYSLEMWRRLHPRPDHSPRVA